MRKALSIALAVASTATPAFASSSGAAKTYFVGARVPFRSTVQSFENGSFKETVTCQQACNVSTRVVIRAAAAKRLGFENFKGKLVVVATNKGSLKAKTPTKMSFTLTPEAKRRLPKAEGVVAVFGAVQAVPNARPNVNYSVGWASTLT